jgi:syntaxin 18
MAFTDITNDFRQAVKERRSTIPDAKRRKVVKSPKGDEEKAAISKTYVAEAYNIVRPFFV